MRMEESPAFSLSPCFLFYFLFGYSKYNELLGLGREGIAGSIVFTPLPREGTGVGSPQKRGNTRLDVAPLSCDIKPLLS